MLAESLPRLRSDASLFRIETLPFEDRKSRFRGLRRLGRGAFGTAFSARLNSKPVIIKLATGTRGILSIASSIRNLAHEVRVLTKLQKFPFVPRLIEVGTDYYVMEDVQGDSMLNLLSKRGLEAEKLLGAIVSSAFMASLLHRDGVAHNDYEARNILLTPNGVVVIDFGLAVLRDEDPEGFKRAMNQDLKSLLEMLALFLSIRKLPDSVKIVGTSTLEKFRKKIVAKDITEDTAADLGRDLVMALAQLAARATRGKETDPAVLRIVAV